MNGRGVRAENTRIDWAELMRFNDPSQIRYENKRMELCQSGYRNLPRARTLLDSTAVEVGEDALVGRHVVVATGAMPRRLGIPGEQVHHSE